LAFYTPQKGVFLFKRVFSVKIRERMLKTQITNLKNEAIGEILETNEVKILEEIRAKFLGRSGKLSELTKEIPKLIPEERKNIGNLIAETKRTIENALRQAGEKIEEKSGEKEEFLDVTAPAIHPTEGHLHLMTEIIREISQIFANLGFHRVRYPEVEWDWYSFGGLNFPENHPARDEWETFFVEDLENKKFGKGLLTPHTSSGQLREMEQTKPPIRMINISKCYRRESGISHAPMFHQFESLVVDKGINITHLKGTLDYFAKNFFGPTRKTRVRPFHFQFTEPSFEVDVSCGLCEGKGCRFCKEGWLELGGAGMVHPNVLKNGGIDPEIYSGFASGFGVERSLMMKSGLAIDDIRYLYTNDFRFLKQF